MQVCKAVNPGVTTLADGRRVACHLYPEKA